MGSSSVQSRRVCQRGYVEEEQMEKPMQSLGLEDQMVWGSSKPFSWSRLDCLIVLSIGQQSSVSALPISGRMVRIYLIIGSQYTQSTSYNIPNLVVRIYVILSPPLKEEMARQRARSPLSLDSMRVRVRGDLAGYNLSQQTRLKMGQSPV